MTSCKTCGICALGVGHRVQGLWPQPRREGKLYRAAVGAQGFPTSGRKGRKKSLVPGEEDYKGLCLCPAPI